MSRWIGFLIAIAIGVGLGLYYTWVVNPVQVVDTAYDSLRIDYRSDYVLMVAEVYQLEGDPAEAARRLGRLGDEPPALIVQQAIIFYEQSPATESDQALLVQLRDALQVWNPAP